MHKEIVELAKKHKDNPSAIFTLTNFFSLLYEYELLYSPHRISPLICLTNRECINDALKEEITDWPGEESEKILLRIASQSIEAQVDNPETYDEAVVSFWKLFEDIYLICGYISPPSEAQPAYKQSLLNSCPNNSKLLQ